MSRILTRLLGFALAIERTIGLARGRVAALSITGWRLGILAPFAKVLVMAVVVAAVTGVKKAEADSIAATVAGFDIFGSERSSVIGWSFTPAVDISVTELGVLDYDRDVRM